MPEMQGQDKDRVVRCMVLPKVQVVNRQGTHGWGTNGQISHKEGEGMIWAVVNVGILLANLVVLGFSLKLYTEYFKERVKH